MNSTQHLTEDQIDDLLIGDLAAEPAAHLAGCDPCQQRVAAARVPIASFKAVSLAWSERRSATLPSAVPPKRSTSWQRYATGAATATAVLVLVLTVPTSRSTSHSADAAPNTAAASTASPVEPMSAAEQPQLRTVAAVRPGNHAPTERQIARDNQMLQAIDMELDGSVASPADVFGAEPGGSRNLLHKRNAPVQELD